MTKYIKKANEDTDKKSLIESCFTLQEIGQYLGDQDLGRLTITSKEMFFNCRKLLEKKAADRLSSHVPRGEAAKALKMIKANPRLLLRPSSEASDYSGRTYKGFTPFQLALLCHDVTLWKEMEPYLDEQEKKKQFKAIFPAGIPQQESYDFNTLIQVISNSSDNDIKAALRNESNGTAICKALEAFRKTFTDLAMKETFFNPSHLIRAFKLHDEQYDIWTENQRDLFWCQVIGYIQRFLPVCYAQAFCQGLYYRVERGQPQGRSLMLGGRSYYPLSPADFFGLGFDFAWRASAFITEASPATGYLVDKLCRANTADLLELEQRLWHDEQSVTNSDNLTSRSWCTIS